MHFDYFHVQTWLEINCHCLWMLEVLESDGLPQAIGKRQIIVFIITFT